MKLDIFNKYYADEYLTSGKTRDNFVFLSCSDKFMKGAKQFLSKDNFGTKSCIFTLTASEEKSVQTTLNLCTSDLQKKLIARDYVCAKIMYSLLYGAKGKQAELQILSDGIKAILLGDIAQAKSFHLKSPMQYDIAQFSKNTNKIELNMFLHNTSNVYLQQAINNFLSSREQYSIKVFTTNKNFATNYDQNGNLVMSPHDFMTKNPQDMLKTASEDMLQDDSKNMSQAASKDMTQNFNQNTLQTESKDMLKSASEDMLQDASKNMPQAASEVMLLEE